MAKTLLHLMVRIGVTAQRELASHSSSNISDRVVQLATADKTMKLFFCA
jgi:hypothetical protein